MCYLYIDLAWGQASFSGGGNVTPGPYQCGYDVGLSAIPTQPKAQAKAAALLERQKSILPPPTIIKVWFSSYNYKTGYFTSLNFSNRAFYLPRAVLKTVCYSNHNFVFFFF